MGDDFGVEKEEGNTLRRMSSDPIEKQDVCDLYMSTEYGSIITFGSRFY